MFELLAHATNLPSEAFVLIFLLTVATSLEALMVVNITPQKAERRSTKLAGYSDKQAENALRQSLTTRTAKASRSIPDQARKRPGRPRTELDAERLLPMFTRILLDGVEPGAIAHVSRDTAAKKLGLTSWQGKTLYRTAVERGYIESCGRRTRACS